MGRACIRAHIAYTTPGGKYRRPCVRSEVFTAVTMKNAVFLEDLNVKKL
jgi:hypothetical protein